MGAAESWGSGTVVTAKDRSGRPVPRRPFLQLVRRITQSLAAKLIAIVFLILLVNLGVLGWVNVKLHRRHLEEMRIESAQRLSSVVQRSTAYYMLRNDREALRQAVQTIGAEPGFVRLRIISDAGRVGFSTDEGEVGSRVVIPGAAIALQQTRTFTLDGQRILGISTPIGNSETCASAACHAHPPSQQMLGLLDVNLSLAEADAEVRRASLQFFAWSGAAILLTLATIAALVWRVVHDPVRALRRGTVRLGCGELGVQIPVRSYDDLGQLAISFNAMSRQLEAAREEADAWARTLEDRVQAKSAELQRAHEQMIQAEKLSSLGKLAAVVAHEINNPLSGILTYARLMRKWIDRGDALEPHKVDMRDSLQLIESESRRCGDIVRNLLTFARVNPLNISDFDVNRIVLQTVKLVEHKLELGNIVPHLELAGDLPAIRGDAGQIEQLLLALVMNAIEAMPHEGNLHIVTASPAHGFVSIAIEDDGFGIPDEVLPRLFEPFNTTKEDKGVGLGLAISRTIVDRHGGRIDVKSEMGRGTTFTITLPIGTTDADDDEPATAGAATGT